MATIGNPIPSPQGLTPAISTRVARPPARAAGAPGTGSREALNAANQLTAAPATGARVSNPLSAIPTSWLPNGSSQRRFEARSGVLRVANGQAQIQRDDQQISVTTPRGNFALRPDPRHPGEVVATTPQGTYRGRISGQGNVFNFETSDGRRSLKIEKKDNYIRFDTEGFGVSDHGHLRVYDR